MTDRSKTHLTVAGDTGLNGRTGQFEAKDWTEEEKK